MACEYSKQNKSSNEVQNIFVRKVNRCEQANIKQPKLIIVDVVISRF